MDGIEAARKIKGRGAASSRSGRFEAFTREVVSDGWTPEADLVEPRPATQILDDSSRTVLARNQSPDVPFDRSINPYRGCEHGCIYCFARPTHAYLGLSPGLDFETKLFVKRDAARQLRAELSKPGYRPAPIGFGANTDPYQPIDRDFAISRAILGVLRDFRHPVMVTTKGALVARDADILAEMAAEGLASVAISVTTLDRHLANRMEPRASTPALRLKAIETLAKAGVPVTILTAPIIPGLTDHEFEAILAAGADAGASGAGYTLLRLPLEIKDLVIEWLELNAPDRKDKVLNHVRSIRGGALNVAEFGARMKGQGPYAEIIRQRFRLACKKHGLDGPRPALRCDLFQVPGRAKQLDLL